MTEDHTPTVDPAALVAALEAAGFTCDGVHEGFARYRSPGWPHTLVVRLDPTAPEAAGWNAGVLDDLRAAAAFGDRAYRVLAAVGPRPRLDVNEPGRLDAGEAA